MCFVCAPFIYTTVEAKRGHQIPGTRGTNDHEPFCGCCELNLSPVKEQSVFLTTEPFIQPLSYIFLVYHVIKWELPTKILCVLKKKGLLKGTGATAFLTYK